MGIAERISTNSVMFARVAGSSDEDPAFPRVEQLARTNWTSLIVNDDSPIAKWVAVAYDPRGQSYSDEDWRAMDVTNLEALLAMLTVPADDIPHIRHDYRHVTSSERREREGSVWTWTTDGEDEAIVADIAWYHGYDLPLLIMPVPTEWERERTTEDEWGNETFHGDSDAAINYDRMIEARDSLDDYPLLDEDAYSAREWEAWQEYAPQAFRDEVRDACRDAYRDDTTSAHADVDWRDADETAVEWVEDNADELLGLVCQHLNYSYGFSGEYAPTMLSILEDLLGEAITAGIVGAVAAINLFPRSFAWKGVS